MRQHPGEVPAGEGPHDWQVVTLAELAGRLVPASTPANRPWVVAIDGRGGAGKSWLVERLQRLVPGSAVVHTDDIAWWHAFFDWDDLLVHGVLDPARRGEGVRFRPPAWEVRGREGAIEVPVGTRVLWVEGTGVLRRTLDAWIDASAYVQGDLDEQDRRTTARGVDSEEFLAEWLAVEQPFLLRERPWEHADVVVDGTSRLPPDADHVAIVGPVRPWDEPGGGVAAG